MRRIVSLLLIAVLCLSLCACAATETLTTNPGGDSDNVSYLGSNTGNQNAKPLTEDPNGFESVEEFLDFYEKYSSGAVTKEDIKKMFPASSVTTIPKYTGYSMDDIYSEYLSKSQDSKNGIISAHGSDFTVTCTLISCNKSEKPNEASEEDKEYVKMIYGVDWERIERYALSFTISVNGKQLPPCESVILRIGNKWYPVHDI